jgi:hypothetical protein
MSEHEPVEPAVGAEPPVAGDGPPVAAGPPPAADAAAPPTHLVIALVSLLFCWPFGIPAIVLSSRVSSAWAAGETDRAVDASARARRFAVIAIGLGALVYVLYFVLALVVVGPG